MIKPLPVLFAVFIALSALIGCAGNPPSDDSKQQQASTLYKEAHGLLEAGDYQTAVKRFEDLQAKYPFGSYSEQAQIDVIYAYYKAGDDTSAVAAADRFIRFNPRHPKVDYAYYMKGVAQQEQGRGFTAKLLRLDRATRDPDPLRQAFYSFRTLIEVHPESHYVNDARRRMVQIRNLLAQHEADVMEFYARRGAWVAAINRACDIVRSYSATPAVAQALHVLMQGYGHIDLPALKEDVRRVIRLNYPNHPALKENG
jgi:outer membrane protein assembly factor BamD